MTDSKIFFPENFKLRNILVASTPAPGHVNPMLAAACHLHDAGYRIIFNTAEIFRRQAESENLRFVHFTGFATLTITVWTKPSQRETISNRARLSLVTTSSIALDGQCPTNIWAFCKSWRKRT